ncbi:MAG: TolC family protein [Bacteroidetes bacterium]|nr:TolC family protein [Bacteroidota bacterium]
MKTKLFTFLLLLFSSASLFSQQKLSLKEFIEIALERNYSIRIMSNYEKIAENNFSRGNAGLLPRIGLNSSYSGTYNNTDQIFIDEADRKLRNIYNTTSFTGLQANWMLFEGFRAQNRYKQLGEIKDFAELNTRIAVENMVANLASEYYFYIQQTRLFSNLQYAVDLSRERVRIEQEHFLLGSGSKVTLLQAQVNLNADSSRLERQYEVLRASRVRLAEVIAEPDLTNHITPSDTNIVVNSFLIYDELLKEVEQNNVSILAAKKNLSISEFDIDMVKSKRYPYLNLISGYGHTYNTFQSGQIVNQQTWGMNFSVTLGFNIYDGRNTQRQISNARIETDTKTLNLDLTKQEVIGDLITIYNAYTNNLRLLELETQNLEVARENLDIAFERYRLGALSGFELREVQKNLLEAEERMLSIQYQAKMAEISLLQISGKILD